MSRVIHIWPMDPKREGDQLTLSAGIECDGTAPRRLWYRVPEQHFESPPETHEHFLLGSLYLAMREPSNLHVHGAVSSTLLRNLDEFQRAWRMWVPDLYRPAEITVDRAVPDTDAPRRGDDGRAILVFSGGVDSCFTAYRHTKNATNPFPRRLAAGVMVQGFDIPLDQPDVFDRAAVKSRELVGTLGLDLLTVATNLREHVGDWTHSFGAALASVLMLFQGRFGQGLIAQGIGYGPNQYYVNGSSPAIDPLLSSGAMEIVPDAAGYPRAEKILAMKDWSEFLRLLRVCWRGAQLDRNCCKCEKCIRTILIFRALGLGLPPCFSSDVTDSQIARMNGISEIQISYSYDPILRLARASDPGAPWVRVLEGAIATSRRIRRSKAYATYHYYTRRIARVLQDHPTSR